MTLGSQFLIFTGIEKVISVIDKSSGADRILDEVSVDELKQDSIGTGSPTKWAVYRMNANTVQILMDYVPQAALTLYADGYAVASTLSGSQEPAFPESYHEVLIEGVCELEYLKLEKTALAAIANQKYEKLLSNLRFFRASSAFKDIYQGKTSQTSTSSTGATGGGSSTPNGASSYTQTGLITFDRSGAGPSADAPFAVASGADKVVNLDADLLDGENGTAYHDLANATGVLGETHGGTGQSTITQGDLLYGSAANTLAKLAKNASATRYLSNTGGSNNPAWAQVALATGVTGTLPDASFPATLPAASGANLTALNATQLTTGTIPQARLGAPQDIGLVEGRLTLTTAVPVTTADVTGAATVYFTPYKGNRVALYDGANWNIYAFTEKSLALGTITNDLPYDVFIYDNAGTPTLELLAWTSKTARATALVLQDGVLSKTGALTRRYLGTFHTTATTTTEDSFAKRLLWNYYNRVARPGRNATETADNWSYGTATFRQANANTANQVSCVVGVAEVMVDVDILAFSSPGGYVYVGVGENSTTTAVAGSLAIAVGGGTRVPLIATVRKYAPLGYSFYAWLEQASGATTFFGDDGVPGSVQSGIQLTLHS